MAATGSGDQATSVPMVTRGGGSELIADLAIAEVVAPAVLEVPAVAALTAGRGPIAGTYGPHKMVKGVVVQHGADGRLTLDVHVVAREAVVLAASRIAPQATGKAALPKLADAIRKRVMRAMKEAGLPPLASVDVYFDDMV